LYLKFIPSEVYGAWLATGNVLFWLGVLDPGFSQVILQRVSLFYGASELDKVGQYAFFGIVIGIIVSVLIGILGLFFYYNFSDWLNLENLKGLSELKYAFVLSLFGTCLMMFSYSITSINQGLQSSLGIGMVYFIANIASILFTIILLYRGYGIITLGFVASLRGVIYLAGNAIYLIYRLYNEDIKIRYSKSSIGDFSSLISYNFLGKIGNTITSQVNSFFIARMLGTNSVTILKFSQSAPEISKLFLVRPALAIMPALTHLIGEGDLEKARQVLLRLIYFTIWGLGISLCGFIVFNESFIRLWVGEEFYGGHTLNILICILMALTIVTEAQSSLVFSLGDIKKSNLIIFVQAIFFIIILVPFIRMFKVNGVIMASILSNLLFSFWYYPYSFYKRSGISFNKIRPLIFEIIKVLIVTVCIILFFKRSQITNWMNFVIQISYLIVAYFGFFILISKSFRNELIILRHKIK
jgi:O-antigen/teichoic acid export membrane protein